MFALHATHLLGLLKMNEATGFWPDIKVVTAIQTSFRDDNERCHLHNINTVQSMLHTSSLQTHDKSLTTPNRTPRYQSVWVAYISPGLPTPCCLFLPERNVRVPPWYERRKRRKLLPVTRSAGNETQFCQWSVIIKGALPFWIFNIMAVLLWKPSPVLKILQKHL